MDQSMLSQNEAVTLLEDVIGEAKDERGKAIAAIWKKLPPDSKGKRDGRHKVMFTGDFAKAMGKKPYESGFLEDLSDDDLKKAVAALGLKVEGFQAEAGGSAAPGMFRSWASKVGNALKEAVPNLKHWATSPEEKKVVSVAERAAKELGPFTDAEESISQTRREISEASEIDVSQIPKECKAIVDLIPLKPVQAWSGAHGIIVNFDGNSGQVGAPGRIGKDTMKKIVNHPRFRWIEIGEDPSVGM